ncbi:MAG: hypothetical protein QOI83_1530, partial [Streptomycetaceae bacterium]|nr:hypothetical protein [Streptomycetaceae bacterium]
MSNRPVPVNIGDTLPNERTGSGVDSATIRSAITAAITHTSYVR